MHLLSSVYSIVFTLYGGFSNVSAEESLFDLDAVASQMAKTSADVLRVEEGSYIKVELKEDLARLTHSLKL